MLKFAAPMSNAALPIALALSVFALLLLACMHRAAEYDTPTPSPASETHEQGVFHHDRALERLDQADYDNAVADMDKARRLLDPQLVHQYADTMRDVYYRSGVAYYDTGLYDQSALLFDKALAVKASAARQAEIHYWRGMSHYRKGRHRQAIADFDAVIELEGKYLDAAHYRQLAQEELSE